ncbi:hypothetical protein [Bacillus cereus]
MKEINCIVDDSDYIKVSDVSTAYSSVDVKVVQFGKANSVALNLKGIKKLRKALKQAQRELEELDRN